MKVGLIPGGGGTQRLPRLVGVGKAMEMILSGRLYAAEEALKQGLVHRVVPDDKLLAEAAEFLKPILKNPPYALSQAKRAVRASQKTSLTEGLRLKPKSSKSVSPKIISSTSCVSNSRPAICKPRPNCRIGPVKKPAKKEGDGCEGHRHCRKLTVQK